MDIGVDVFKILTIYQSCTEISMLSENLVLHFISLFTGVIHIFVYHFKNVFLEGIQ